MINTLLFCCSVAKSCLTVCDPWTAAQQASLSFTNSQSLIKLIFTESMIPSSNLILCHPLLLNLSQHKGFFQWVSFSHQVAKVLEFQLQYQSFQWIFRVGFFNIDWFDLLAIQESLTSLFQHNSSKASILLHLALFIIQLSHPHMTTWKTVAWTIWTFVGKVMSLLFNMLSRFVISSVQFSLSVVSDYLWPHGLQNTRPPCLSPTPGVYSNSCPLSWWCHPTISSSVIPFASCLQSFPASGSFPMSQFFTSGGQSIGVSASLSVLPVDIQNWFPLGWTVGSPCSPRDSQESSPTRQFKSINSLSLSFLYSPTLTSIHNYWKNRSFD